MMKRKALLYAIATLLIFSITQVFSGESNISVWLSDLSVYYKGEKIEFTDANGNACDGFIYNGITYVPLRSIAETMGKEVYWNGDEKAVNIEDEPIVDEVIIKRSSYMMSVELIDEEEEKALESFDEKVLTLKPDADGVYRHELDYFEPIPEIEVKTNEGCSSKIFSQSDKKHNIEIFNATGKKITEYTVIFERRPFGEYLKSSSEIAKYLEERIKKISAYWNDANSAITVECYRTGEDSWSTHAHEIGTNGASTENVYNIPLVYEPEMALTFMWNYPTYGVYTMKDGVEKELYFVTKGDYAPTHEYAKFDAKKTDHTIVIDYFENLPTIIITNNKTVNEYDIRKKQRATPDNPVTLVNVYSVVNDRLVLESEHKINYKRRSLEETLKSRGISLEDIKDADEIYSRILYSDEKYMLCKKDENGEWITEKGDKVL